ncbi:uncharacterized protein [Salminus brasiliensis]|uniref:uncharacterized protein isoform X2 n=1 Tax=Salminus brasiliensis TaxID=930266 RepID=UPI003B82FB7D
MYPQVTSILHLMLLIYTQGSRSQALWTVRCNEESICALRESVVVLACSYSDSNIRSVMWFSPKQRAKWRSEELPEDLVLDSDYAGRVDYIKTTNSTCHLRIRDLKEKDSGEYRLMAITANGGIHVSSTAVNLTITDIEVKTHHGTVEQQPVSLICNTSCKLNMYWSMWYNNGQRVQVTSYQNAEPLVLSSNKSGSYYCSLKDHRKTIYSAAVYRSICALEGSSVTIPCTYSYPSDRTLNETYWSYNTNDLRKMKHFAGRVEYAGRENKNCTLRLTDLKQSDSGNYHFSFTTNAASEVFSGSSEVQLTVASVDGRVSAATVSGQTVILSCKTTCTLTDDTTYIWYKNRQTITNKVTKYNKLYLDLPSYKETDDYTCAVRGVKGDEGAAGDWWAHPTIWGAAGVMALLLVSLSAVLYNRWKRGAEAESRSQSCPRSEENTYAALTTVTTPTYYHILRTAPTNNIYTTLNPEPANDTGVYTELQKGAPEAEYETLQRKLPTEADTKPGVME